VISDAIYLLQAYRTAVGPAICCFNSNLLLINLAVSKLLEM